MSMEYDFLGEFVNWVDDSGVFDPNNLFLNKCNIEDRYNLVAIWRNKELQAKLIVNFLTYEVTLTISFEDDSWIVYGDFINDDLGFEDPFWLNVKEQVNRLMYARYSELSCSSCGCGYRSASYFRGQPQEECYRCKIVLVKPKEEEDE